MREPGPGGRRARAGRGRAGGLARAAGGLPSLAAAAVLGAFAAAPGGAQQEPLQAGGVPTTLGEAVRHGSGPDTLVLVPCASCRWRSRDGFMRRNAQRCTVYAVTLPGYGGTDVPDLPMWTASTVWRDHALEGPSALLDAPFLDVRAIRPWDDAPEETLRGIEETMEEIGPGPGCRRALLHDTPHFVLEERPELVDRLVADLLAGRPVEDARPAGPPSAPPTVAGSVGPVTADVRAAAERVDRALARIGGAEALRRVGGSCWRRRGSRTPGRSSRASIPTP